MMQSPFRDGPLDDGLRLAGLSQMDATWGIGCDSRGHVTPRRNDRNDFPPTSAVASLGHVTRARICQILNLIHLAPDIQEALLFLPPTLVSAEVPPRARSPRRPGRSRQPDWPRAQLRPAAAAAGARAARRVVPVLRRLLLQLPPQRPHGLHSRHRHVARRVPLRYHAGRVGEAGREGQMTEFVILTWRMTASL
jgi:hypothetical protein